MVLEVTVFLFSPPCCLYLFYCGALQLGSDLDTVMRAALFGLITPQDSTLGKSISIMFELVVGTKIICAFVCK